MPMSVAPNKPETRPQRILGCLTGLRPGPTLVIVGGLHGNEPAGLLAAQRVLDRLRREELPVAGRVLAVRGNLTALTANDPASRGHPRYIDADLNRLFLPITDAEAPDALEGVGVEHAERRELAQMLEEAASTSDGATHVIDLHTVSSNSPPFIAVEDSLPGRRFAMAFPLPKILGIEEELPGLLMDDATNRLGCISTVIEAGHHADPFSVDVHEAAIWVALDAAGILPLASVSHKEDPKTLLRRASNSRADHVYEIRYRASIHSHDFEIRPDLDAFTRVRARRSAIATDAGRTLITPVSGLLFMPNRQPDPRKGDDAYFVVHRIGWLWLRLSAWLRTRTWAHALLPKLLPGVRRCSRRPHHLLIAPDIAVILQRQVFHLMGYRVIRMGPHKFDTLPVRLRNAFVEATAAAYRLITGLFHGGEPAALPTERPEDWVVRRRTLDLEMLVHTCEE